VKVTKGQAEIDGEREQREPCSVPYFVPEPAHLLLSRKSFKGFSRGGILYEPAIGSNATPAGL
jgi:hypothetical protein